MTASPPRRRVVPEPVETIAKSSRRLNRGDPETQLADRIPDQVSAPSTAPNSLSSEQMKPNTTTRRFPPQAIEISVRTTKVSNREKGEESSEEGRHVKDSSVTGRGEGSTDRNNEPRQFTPQSVKAPAKSPRKFALEPVETSTRSNRRGKGEAQDEEKPHSTRRRFAPEPVETSTKTSRKKSPEPIQEPEAPPPRRRFAPEPIETTIKSNHNKQANATEDSSSQGARRRFAPEAVETTVRRRRKHTVEEQPDLSVAFLQLAPPTKAYSPGSFHRGFLGSLPCVADCLILQMISTEK